MLDKVANQPIDMSVRNQSGVCTLDANNQHEVL